MMELVAGDGACRRPNRSEMNVDNQRLRGGVYTSKGIASRPRRRDAIGYWDGATAGPLGGGKGNVGSLVKGGEGAH